MQKKRALIIAYNDLNNSGVPNVIFQIVSSLNELYDFDIITFGDDKYYFDKLQTKGILAGLIRFKAKTKGGKSTGIIYHLFSYPKLMYKQALELMKHRQYDVLHSFKENYSWPFLKAAKKCGIQNRIIHSNIDNTRNGSLAFKVLNTFNKIKTLKYATHFVGVSKRCCENSYGNKNYIVLHNTYDENRFNLNLKFDGDRNRLTLVQIGTLNSNKNQLFSLKIASILKQKMIDFSLTLIGKETEKGYQHKLNDFISENMLDQNVEVINNAVDITNAYKKSKYVLIPSKTEGASIVAIEAQACGMTVFASTGVPPDMNLGGMVFLDKKKTPQDWAELILDSNKHEYSRKQYDTRDFSRSEFKNKLLKLYNS